MTPPDARSPKPRSKRSHVGPDRSARGPCSTPTQRQGAWDSAPRPQASPLSMQTLRGIAVSPGVAIGPALVLDPRGPRLPLRAIAAEAVSAELERLDRGLESALAEAELAEVEARQRLGPQYADILAAHAQMIADPTLRRDARQKIESDQIAAEHAVCEVLEGHAARLERLADSHLAARAADVRHIEKRILYQLSGQRPASVVEELDGPTVILAHDLSPSETAGLDPQRVLGFATEAGGRASHTAIVAEALEIPAVVGLGRFLDRASDSRMAIIDGDEGLVVLDPHPPPPERHPPPPPPRAPRVPGRPRGPPPAAPEARP